MKHQAEAMELPIRTKPRPWASLCLRAPAIAIFMALNLLGVGQISAGSAYHGGGTIDVQHADWMSWLPDDVPLATLSIPSTHDTMADCSNGCPDPILDFVTTTPFSKTQSLSLSEQLQAGVRGLDIRVKANGQSFELVHGDVDLGYEFGNDVLDVIADFLDQHPMETVLMRIKRDAGAEAGSSPFNVIFNIYERNYPIFWQPDLTDVDRIPTLGEVRGKIIVLQDAGFSDDYDQQEGPRWNSLNLEDTWKPDSVNHKLNLVREHFMAADVDESALNLFVTFTSAAFNEDRLPEVITPEDWAEDINPLVLDYLFEQNQATKTGLIMMDFPGPALISAIVAYNFKYGREGDVLDADWEQFVTQITASADGDPTRSEHLDDFLNSAEKIPQDVPNDNCVDAIRIMDSDSDSWFLEINLNFDDANYDAESPRWPGDTELPKRNLWYTYTAPSNGILTVSVVENDDNSPSVPTALQIFDSCGELSGARTDSGSEASIGWGLQAGETILVRASLDGWADDLRAALQFEFGLKFTNDDSADAIDIFASEVGEGLPVRIENLYGATVDGAAACDPTSEGPADPFGTAAGPDGFGDVWYRYWNDTAVARRVTLDWSQAMTAISIHEDPAAPAEVCAWNDFHPGSIALVVPPGEDRYIRIASLGANQFLDNEYRSYRFGFTVYSETDTVAPSITAPSDVTVECTSYSDEIVDLGVPEVSDNFDSNPRVELDAPRAGRDFIFPLGETIVTWTATDSAGNTATDTQRVTVVDTIPPTFVESPRNRTISCDDHLGMILQAPWVEDACDRNPRVTSDAPEVFPPGVTTVTWTARDDSGNTATVTQQVTVVDSGAPSITAPADLDVEINTRLGAAVDLGAPQVSDDCDSALSVSNNAPDHFPLGFTAVAWTVTDRSGNTAAAIQWVRVVDTTAPTIDLKGSRIVQCGSPNVSSANLFDSLPPAIRDFGDPEPQVTNNAPKTFPPGNTFVTWTATDESGNSATATHVVTVVDTDAPTITPPADLTIEFTTPLGERPSLGDPEVSDSCDTAPEVTNDAPRFFHLGVTTVTWTVRDADDNSATATQLVTVVDTTAPTITAPADLTVECTDPLGETIGFRLGTPAIADASPTRPAVENDAPSRFLLGVTEVTWTATDASGNSATATQVVTVVDTTPPSITAPADLTVECTNPLAETVALGSPVVSDTCDTSPEVTNDAPASFQMGENTVTWFATDASGNTATATQVVTVVDTTAPSITAPADITVESTNPLGNTVPLGTPVVSDVCDPNPLVRHDAPAILPMGTTEVIWTATDASGNSATAIQSVTVADTTPPTITAPADITVESTNPLGDTVPLGMPIVSDTGDPNPLVRHDAPPFFPLGATTVTWTATDASGNFTTATQVVTIVDTTPPVITLTGANPQVIECANPYTELGATAFDTRDEGLTGSILVDSSAVDTSRLGSYIVTYNVSDTSGNPAVEVTRVVIVQDTVPPTIIAPAELMVECTHPSGNTVALGLPIASDACDAALVVTNDAPGVFPLGATTVTWTATDASGNSATATQVVTVVDTTAPTITAPTDLTVESTNRLGDTVPLIDPIVSDACDPNPLVRHDAPAIFPLGATTVTWTATDASGNTATATQVVTVVDTTPPVITLTGANPQVIECSGQYTEQGATAFDTRDEGLADSIIVDSSAVDGTKLGSYIVTYNVSDAAGNAATEVTRVVIVQDTVAPTITAPGDMTVECTDPLGETVALGIPIASDACDASPVVTNDAPPVFPMGATVVTWTATDASGNSATATQVVTVVDTTAPTITAPSDMTVESTNSLGETVAVGAPIVSDACDPNPLVRHDGPAIFPMGATTVTWTTTDASGNSATATQVVTVVDTTPPVITLIGSNPQVIECSDPYIELGATASDARDGDLSGSILIDRSGVDWITVGSYTITYNVSDAAGNAAAEVTRVVTVQDTVAPNITTCPSDLLIESDGDGNVAEINVWLASFAATDHCGIQSLANDYTGLSVECGATGSALVTFTATDANGNSSTCSATVTVEDRTAPVITAEASDLTVESDGRGNVADLKAWLDSNGTTGAASELGSDVSWSHNFSALSDDCGATGSATVVFTASDECGNSTITAATFTIVDTTSPDLVCELQLVDGKKKDARFLVVATASDIDCTDLALSAQLAVGNQLVPVNAGQLVRLKIQKKIKIDRTKKGLLIVKGPSFQLNVTAVDDCGNQADCSSLPVFPADGGKGGNSEKSGSSSKSSSSKSGSSSRIDNDGKLEDSKGKGGKFVDSLISRIQEKVADAKSSKKNKSRD